MNQPSTPPLRYRAADLISLASALLKRAGLDSDKAKVTASILVEGDLLGHTTHGLALLPQYLKELDAGRMSREGLWDVRSAVGSVETWDGKRLPGPWLVTHASQRAETLSAEYGLGGVAIQRSGHIACLAAYLRPAAERGHMIIIASSDPSTASVALHGGTTRLITPNPLAAGWPSPDGPVMIDVSMSGTTNAMTARLHREGAQFEHPMLLDTDGNPTRDPDAYFKGGALLPLGGAEAGHKGYALGLMIEALTSALAGHGRADSDHQWGASVLVLAIDPTRFSGAESFMRETGWIADKVKSSAPIPGREAPRLPGQKGLEFRKQQLSLGVKLHREVVAELAALASAAGLPLTPVDAVGLR